MTSIIRNSHVESQNLRLLAGGVVLLAMSVLFAAPPDDSVTVEAQFLGRGDLPEDFRFPILELDFAVLRVIVTNGGETSWTFRPQDLTVREKKGKRLTRVAPTEVTPKIVNSKAFRRMNQTVHGQVGYPYPGSVAGGNPAPYRVDSIPTIPSGRRVISADTGTRIRTTLEEHEVKETKLAPGKNVEGLVYFKSKKSAPKLSGSTLVLGNGRQVTVR